MGCLSLASGLPIDCGDTDAYVPNISGNQSSGSVLLPNTGQVPLTSSSVNQDYLSIPSVASVSSVASDAHSSASSGGGTALSSTLSFLGGLSQTITKAVTSTPSSSSQLKLQLNPATGTYQYYNPTTNSYLPSATSGSLFGGGSSMLWIALAAIVAFFAFGAFKKKGATA